MGLKKGYDSPSILWEFYWNVHVCTHIKRVCLSAQISLHKIASCFTSLYEQRIQCYNARENKVGTHRDMFIVSGYPIFVMSGKNHPYMLGLPLGLLFHIPRWLETSHSLPTMFDDTVLGNCPHHDM